MAKIRYVRRSLILSAECNSNHYYRTGGNQLVTSSRKLRRLLVLLFAVTALLMAGAVPGLAQGAPVKIGGLFPMTGDLGAFGQPFFDSAMLAIDQVNEQGGLLGGRRLELVLADSQTNPIQGVPAAQRLVNIHRVPAIIGAASSGVTIPVATSVTIPNQVVHISMASTSPEITTLDDDDFVFRTVASDTMQGLVLGKLAKRLGYHRTAVMYVNNSYGLGLAQNFEKSFTEQGGVVTANVAFDQEKVSYRGELDRAARDGAEALVLISYPESGITILRQSLEGGYFGKFLFTEGMQAPEVVEAIGPDLEGAWGTGPYSAETPATALFKAYYEARHGQHPATAFMYETYDAAFVIALAIEKAGEATGPAVRDAIRQVTNPPGEVILPGEWAKAVQLIRDGVEIQYVGASRPGHLRRKRRHRGGHHRHVDGGERRNQSRRPRSRW